MDGFCQIGFSFVCLLPVCYLVLGGYLPGDEVLQQRKSSVVDRSRSDGQPVFGVFVDRNIVDRKLNHSLEFDRLAWKHYLTGFNG